MQMRIEPKNGYLLLETFDLPKEQGKLILPNTPKDTQIYNVVFSEDTSLRGKLVYLRCAPDYILQNDFKVYFTKPENVIAVVEL